MTDYCEYNFVLTNFGKLGNCTYPKIIFRKPFRNLKKLQKIVGKPLHSIHHKISCLVASKFSMKQLCPVYM